MTNNNTKIHVLTFCNFFQNGIRDIFSGCGINFVFINKIEQVKIDLDDSLTILLVLDMSGSEALKNFKDSINYLNQINIHKRIGVIVSRYNSYMSHYIYHKLKRKVTFFNAHNVRNGLFEKNIKTWLNGKTFKPMHVVNNYRDECYGLSLKEWLSLVIPLSGESMQEMSCCMNVSSHTLYQIRNKALKKIGITSYRQFCELYIRGEIRAENDRVIRK